LDYNVKDKDIEFVAITKEEEEVEEDNNKDDSSDSNGN